MILIWNGLGILVAVIWVGSVVISNWMSKVLFGPDVSRGLRDLTGEWLAALLTLVLALLLRIQQSSGDPWEKIDAPRPNHSLFFIPVIVWPAIFFIIGLVLYLR